jgi:FkbM family methyltransferase
MKCGEREMSIYLQRVIRFFDLRIAPFVAKFMGREPYVNWGDLVKEHLIMYPYFRIKNLFIKPKQKFLYTEEPYDNSRKIIRIDGHKVFWPIEMNSAVVIDGYRNTFREDEPDNYFRFYIPKPLDVVLDLGACEGFFALELLDKVKKIYCFEAIPALCESLSLTLSNGIRDGVVEIYNYALSNQIGDVDFFMLDSINASTMESIKTNNCGIIEKISVPGITLDAFIEMKNIHNISIIKMDIEGAEYSALEGAKGILEKHKPDLLVSAYHYPYDCERLSEFLKKMGYTISLSPLIYTDQNGQDRPHYRHALIHATHA